jgi:cobalt/nickel transport system permease protein
MKKLIILGMIFLISTFFFKYKYESARSKHPHNKIRHKHAQGIFIDLYAYNSQIRHWNATFKVSLSFLTMILCIALNNPYVSSVVIIAMAYITIEKGKLPIREYLSILMIPMIFILLSIFTIIINFSKQPIGLYNLNLGFCYVFTTESMLKEGLFLLLKIFSAISALQMMSLSTPSSEIIYVLRKVGIPKLFVELMNLIYRYIFILTDVFIKMKNSAESRLGYCDFKTSCYTFGNSASNMLVVSLKKANTYYDAMEARGYDGDLIFLQEDKKLDMLLIIEAIAFIFFLLLIWSFTT